MNHFFFFFSNSLIKNMNIPCTILCLINKSASVSIRCVYTVILPIMNMHFTTKNVSFNGSANN